MNIEEFRASKTEIADLGLHMNDDMLMGVAGFVYGPDKMLYIAKTPNTVSGETNYHLLIANDEWVGGESELPNMEELLFDWARDEGCLG